MATCFAPTGSSSGLNYETDLLKTAYILGIPIMFTDDNYKQIIVEIGQEFVYSYHF